MPLAAALYRASGLVHCHLADVGVLANVRFAPEAVGQRGPSCVSSVSATQ
jgi:hypothetical protein